MRIQRKKKPEGSLTIRAVERGEEIVVSIQDDGGGLDAGKIKKKAVERGLYSAQDVEQLSTQKIYSLIFESGFSTASQITDVSGRGVGMDMVRSSVQKIKGRVEIESELGKGTTFSLHLPIPKSVLIINSLVVEACGRDFAIAQDSIARLLRLEGKRVRQSPAWKSVS
jgi:two-component system chemotaxis sensor kinase CheA